VTPGYFQALRVPVLEGRDFSARDTLPSPPVVVVNRTFAKRWCSLRRASLRGTDGMYEAMAKQAGESRVYAGIHYPMDLDTGFEIARKVAARALEVGLARDKPFMPLGQ